MLNLPTSDAVIVTRKALVVALVLAATAPALAASGDGKTDSASADGKPTLAFETPAGDAHDVALHKLHLEASGPQVESAEAFASALTKQAAASQVDLSSFVADARRLADADPPLPREQEVKAEQAHRDTLQRVESALGLPGLFGTLRGGGAPPPEPGQPSVVTAGGGCDCSRLEFLAPHPGSFHRNYPLGAASVSPAPVSELSAEFRSGVIAAGHQVAGTGESFVAPAGIRAVTASATMGLFADVGVGGVGVAHGWSDVQLVVSDRATGAEACRTRFETNNRATGAWYYRDIRDHGERTLSCSFVRDPAVATNYAVTIELRAYGTYAGLVGGHSVLRAKLKRIDVQLCP